MRSSPSNKDFPIALTMGEPAGIGPDITLRAWHHLTAQTNPTNLRFFVIGDGDILTERARQLGLNIPMKIISDPSEAAAIFPHALPILPINSIAAAASPLVAGQLNGDYAPMVIAAIAKAVELVKQNRARAVVTNPIQKSILQQTGFPFPGHTEFLAQLDSDVDGNAPKKVAMMLVSTQVDPPLRVVPMTIHIPLSRVMSELTPTRIIEQAHITENDLRRRFSIANPRLAVTGLNPHAGEAGLMGDEEIRIMSPAIAQLQQSGMNITGPLAADSLFHPAARRQFDAILCCYHDQALIPIKTLDFMGGVNVTLGLSFIRTSPDHGTALGIAGQKSDPNNNNIGADPTSLLAALKLAESLH
ncbi:MAG: 4-hydroxythreonine-4-phosphate dehydrogenase PdxA [Alphaproteobacteria bacterium]|nr:4-hydroxythreonine-4-phosphate dehydrogenase PdxA [Alphaproteobacteria bacterium]